MLIVCGDFGYIYDGSKTEKQVVDFLSSRRFVTAFIDGTHDNMKKINSSRITYWHGGMVHRIKGNLLHLCRGQIFDIEGKTSLLAYLLELTSMMAICEENEIAKDLYTSVYKHPMSLKLIRESDTEKIKSIFAEYCPGWTDEDFALTENAVSGIEYASLMRENAEDVPLDKRIAKTLNVVMKAYNVPEDVREQKIQKVLSIDYRRIGRQFIAGFTEYVETANQRALEEGRRI